jgi:hypothetical protein
MEGVEYPVEHRQLGAAPHPFEIEDRLGLLLLVGQEDDHADARLRDGVLDPIGRSRESRPATGIEGRTGEEEAGSAGSRDHDDLLGVGPESDATPGTLP